VRKSIKKGNWQARMKLYLVSLLSIFSFSLLAQDVDYYYKSDKAKMSISETSINVEAMYDCAVQMGRRFTNNKYLVNSFGLSSVNGIVYFQGASGSENGIYFVREGQMYFVAYSSQAEGEIRVFEENDPVSIGIRKTGTGHTVGTKKSFENGGLRYPTSRYVSKPKKVEAGGQFVTSFASGLDNCLDQFCPMFTSRKKKFEDESFAEGEGMQFMDMNEYSALQTCRHVLKSMGQTTLASKVEGLIKNCLGAELDPKKGMIDEKSNTKPTKTQDEGITK